MVSLTLYNRRQKALWMEKEIETLNQARIAQANGSATEEQLELIKKEEIGDIYKRKRDEEKAQRPWAKAKAMLFGKMNAEDTGLSGAPTAASSATESSSIIDAVEAKKAFESAATKTGAPMPGQLDVMAENAEQAAKEKSKGWFSWATGR